MLTSQRKIQSAERQGHSFALGVHGYSKREQWSECVSCSVVSNSATPWIGACQSPLSMGFSKQEYWSGLPFPNAGDLLNSGIEPKSSTQQADSLPSESLRKTLENGYSRREQLILLNTTQKMQVLFLSQGPLVSGYSRREQLMLLNTTQKMKVLFLSQGRSIHILI